MAIKSINYNDKEPVCKVEEPRSTTLNIFYTKKFKHCAVFFSVFLCSIIFLCSRYIDNNRSLYNQEEYMALYASYCYNTVDAKLNLKNEDYIKDFYEDYADKDIRINQRTLYLNEINLELANTSNFVYVIKNPDGTIYDTNILNNPNVTATTASDGQTAYYYTTPIDYEYLEITETSPSSITENYSTVYTYINSLPNEKVTCYNDPVTILQQNDDYIYFKGKTSSSALYNNREHDIAYLLYLIDAQDYEIHFAIMNPLTVSNNSTIDVFLSLDNQRSEIVPTYDLATMILGLTCTLLVIIIVCLTITSGQNSSHSVAKTYLIDKLYFDVHAGLSFTLFIVIALILESTRFAMLSLCLVAPLMILELLCSASRLIKNKNFFNNTLICFILISAIVFLKNIIEAFKDNHTYHIVSLLLLLGFFILINGVCYFKLVVQYSFSALAMLFIFSTVMLDLMFILWIINFFINLGKVKKITSNISKGKYDCTVDSKTLMKTFHPLAQNIDNLQNGIATAVEKEVKSERLKTELITNVSHDLKTPLTSIINYVDLLKKEAIDNETAVAYIKVLDEKSARLKQLIEDLVEASKASSGSISVSLEKIDLYQLIQQACGEYEEKLAKNNLEIRITPINSQDSTNQVLVKGDGRHLWRIVENLLSNVSKYALPNSRVYIDINKNIYNGVLTIKNISDLALDISPDQLTDRFVRGDSARSSEGSGLGLSIAQSLTEVQNGHFKILIDGDLFKTIVEIPLWNE